MACRGSEGSAHSGGRNGVEVDDAVGEGEAECALRDRLGDRPGRERRRGADAGAVALGHDAAALHSDERQAEGEFGVRVRRERPVEHVGDPVGVTGELRAGRPGERRPRHAVGLARQLDGSAGQVGSGCRHARGRPKGSSEDQVRRNASAA